jgi:rubrerythrin
MTADQRRRKVAEVRFRERYARERAERARDAGQRGTQSHADDEDTTPAPATRWERFGTTYKPTTTSLTGTNPDVDRVLAQRFGQRQYSAERMREAEERLNKRLSGQRDADEKVPVHQRPEAHATPVCPIDAVPLEVVSYTASMKPAERRCPVCRRTEREMIEKGVDLRPVTEHVRDALNHAGWQKEHVIRRW